jgi:hypothetical protein
MLIVCVASVAVAADHGPAHLNQPGLAAISYQFDSIGRLAAVTADGKMIVRYDWTAGDFPLVRFADQWSIATTLLDAATIHQETFNFKGESVREATASLLGRRYARVPVVLDAVAADLGLPDSWRDDFRFTGPNDAVIGRGPGQAGIRLVPVSPAARVGYVDGSPAFWDLDLPVDFGGRMAGVLPTRLVVTRDGSAQLSAPQPLYDALQSIWVNRRADGIVDTSARFVTDRRDRDRVQADMYWVCGYSERWYCTSDGSSGYCENYYEPNYCWSNDGGGGGGYDPGGDPGGGGGPYVDPLTQEKTNLKNEYQTTCGYTPDDSVFSNASTYNPGPLPDYSFAQLKSPNNSWAIIAPELQQGLADMINYMDNQTPTLTDAYRTPSERPAGSAGCGGHTQGTAVDLSIRNASGNFDCQMWDLMAAAANASGGWVEPWADTVAGGTPHLHVDWGRTPNTPQEYGQCSGY